MMGWSQVVPVFVKEGRGMGLVRRCEVGRVCQWHGKACAQSGTEQSIQQEGRPCFSPPERSLFLATASEGIYPTWFVIWSPEVVDCDVVEWLRGRTVCGGFGDRNPVRTIFCFDYLLGSQSLVLHFNTR